MTRMRKSIPHKWVNHFVSAEKSVVLFDPKNTIYKTRNGNSASSNNQSRPRVKIIIILAYMHTGSTFLGSILQQIPGIYYEYETLRSLQQDSRNRNTVVYMNGSERFVKLLLHRYSTVARRVTNVTSEHYGDP